MLSPHLRTIAEAQTERLRLFRALDPSEFMVLIDKAVTPADVRAAVLKERPVLDMVRAWDLPGPDPHELREEALAVGVLDATAEDVAFRRLYPSLDVGVYCASHSMGKPSLASAYALEEHIGLGALHGVGAWLEGGWLESVDDFGDVLAEILGADPLDGDVAWFANLSEALSAVLSSLEGRLVTTAGHFTTAHYIHAAWARRGGHDVVVVPEDGSGGVELARLLEAITPQTTVVSLSTALYRTGFLHDLDAIARHIEATCPDAALLLDAYQTLGTVPIDVEQLPRYTAVLGGGIKQLRAGPGAGYAWLRTPLLQKLAPDRIGWWAHRDPLAFDHGPFVLGDHAARLRTGTPDLMPMVALTTELRVFATSGHGDVRAAVDRARQRTRGHMEQVVTAMTAAGLTVRGGTDPDRRAAFVGIWLENGAVVAEGLATTGVIVDFRADEAGSKSGTLRMSSNAAAFDYEIQFAIEQLLAHVGALR